MAGRLKRRSSVGIPPGRMDPPAPETPVQPFTQDTEADEEAERRARNLQRKQQQQLNEVSDSPGLDKQGSSGHRPKEGINHLSAAQLAEHYQNCLKLSAENKISSKNAFNLQLIDYMSTMIKNKESEMNNFQIAAGTLDASSKIYAFRVDSVYDSTLKIASGLGHAGKQEGEGEEGREDNQGEDGDMVNPETGAPVKKKRIKKSSTIEKNMKNINLSKLEMEFDVDPLFKKTTSQFDGSSGGNQFLATLRLRGECAEMMLDSDLVVDVIPSTPGKSQVNNNSHLPTVDKPIEGMKVCPTFDTFSFTKWSVDEESKDEEYNRLNESISASQEERAENSTVANNSENAFDAFAIPEPIDDDPGDTGMVDYDMADEDHSVWSERVEGAQRAGHCNPGPGLTATLAMTPSDMLSVLTTAPLEYSYFDHGKMGAWAGPKHWKFRPLAAMAVGDVGQGTKGKKKKVIEQIKFEDYDEFDEDTIKKVKLLLTLPKKSVKLVDKTMKGWSRERSTLPEDHHYSGHELVRLKTVDTMVVAPTKKDPAPEVDGVEDYDYDNPGDNDGYCPDIDDEPDAYGDCDADAGVEQGGFEDQTLTQNNDQTLVGDMDLVQAPKLVDKAALQIGYAKTAKKVDMKKIKLATWRILTQASSENKENVHDPSDKLANRNDNEKTTEEATVEETSFSELYRTLKQPNRLPKVVSESLSVPLAFIALLHLCNEETLKIIPNVNLEDFQILKG